MSQRGSLTVEFAILVPAVMLLFGVAVGGARTWLARSTIEQVAGAAARAASLEYTPTAAVAAGERMARTQLAVGDVRCAPLTVAIDAHALNSPAGVPGQVTATADCDVPLSDVLVPGWPGMMRVSASATAILDTYRRRG